MSTLAEIGAKVLANLGAQAERNRQVGLLLRAEIQALMLKHSGSKPITAQEVRSSLSRENLPSLRRIQKHLRVLRAPSSVGRG